MGQQCCSSESDQPGPLLGADQLALDESLEEGEEGDALEEADAADMHGFDDRQASSPEASVWEAGRTGSRQSRSSSKQSVLSRDSAGSRLALETWRPVSYLSREVNEINSMSS